MYTDDCVYASTGAGGNGRKSQVRVLQRNNAMCVDRCCHKTNLKLIMRRDPSWACMSTVAHWETFVRGSCVSHVVVMNALQYLQLTLYI
jgi:hypothetical protein